MEAFWKFDALLAHGLGLYRNWGPWGKHQKQLTAVFTPCEEAHSPRLYRNLGLYRLTRKVPYFRKAQVLGLYIVHDGRKGYKRVENIPEQYYCVCLMIMVCISMAPFLGFQGGRFATKFVL